MAHLSGLACSVITTSMSFDGKDRFPSYAAQERVKTFVSVSYATGRNASSTWCMKAWLCTATHLPHQSEARISSQQKHQLPGVQAGIRCCTRNDVVFRCFTRTSPKPAPQADVFERELVRSDTHALEPISILMITRKKHEYARRRIRSFRNGTRFHSREVTKADHIEAIAANYKQWRLSV